jgi:ABC-type Fe3+-hydroxamate transport system substrate-binding protein
VAHRLRVVSLVPSATETLLAWDVQPIAVTRFCEQGDRFPTVGGTKNPDLAAITELRPDLVIMCDQENRLSDFDALVAAGLRVHAISITSLVDVGPEMARLAEALDLPTELGTACQASTVPQQVGKRAYVPIWRRPWMTINADTYGMTLLHHLGVRGVADDEANRYPEIDLDEARRRNTDVVLAPSEPYEFGERHRAELETVAPVTFVDGRDLFWWGVRTPDAVRRLADVLSALTP